MNYKDLTSPEPRIGPRAEHREGPVARSIEQHTAKLPSDLFLWAALGSIGTSLIFQLSGDEDHLQESYLPLSHREPYQYGLSCLL